jgi:hypothetical protein
MKAILGILAIADGGRISRLWLFITGLVNEESKDSLHRAGKAAGAAGELPSATMGMDFTQAGRENCECVFTSEPNMSGKSSYYDYFFDFRDFFSMPQPRGRSGSAP